MPSRSRRKTRKMVAEKVSSDTQTNENPGSDNPNSPQNEVPEHEKQTQSRITRNKARMKESGLHKIASSLMDLSRKGGKRKSQPKSKRAAKKSKKDDDYEPNKDEETQKNDSNLDSSNEESGKKKNDSNAETPGSRKVPIPDSSLEFMGMFGEKIRITFPKPSDEVLKAAIDCFPRFNGINRDRAEAAFRGIADLKAKYWKLRRALMYWYPEFREEVIEGLPLPEDFNGFTLEESKEVLRVMLTLEHAYYRLKTYFKSNVHVASICPQVPEALGSNPPGTSCPPSSHASFPQHQASPFVPGTAYGLFSFGMAPIVPNVPFVMAPIPLNPYYANWHPPHAGNHPRKP